MPAWNAIVTAQRIERAILVARGQKVMLDADLAALYRVPTKVLIQAVKRNSARFPKDFMFRLTAEETVRLRSQFVTSNVGRGGRRYLPYAFTEHGVAMLSSVLRSPRAIQANIAIMRAFVRLRALLTSNEALARKLDALEKKYDAQFKVVFDAIRQLMSPPAAGRRTIGFRPRAGGDSVGPVPLRHGHISPAIVLACGASLSFCGPKSDSLWRPSRRASELRSRWHWGHATLKPFAWRTSRRSRPQRPRGRSSSAGRRAGARRVASRS